MFLHRVAEYGTNCDYSSCAFCRCQQMSHAETYFSKLCIASTSRCCDILHCRTTNCDSRLWFSGYGLRAVLQKQTPHINHAGVTVTYVTFNGHVHVTVDWLDLSRHLLTFQEIHQKCTYKLLVSFLMKVTCKKFDCLSVATFTLWMASLWLRRCTHCLIKVKRK